MSSIVFGGSGASRDVTVTPVSGLSGTATITIRVTDGGGLFAEDTFTLTVTDNYLSWATANSVTGGVNGDSDNDGVKNLVEYALVNGGERGVLSGNTITFTKRGGVYGSDLTYIMRDLRDPRLRFMDGRSDARSRASGFQPDDQLHLHPKHSGEEIRPPQGHRPVRLDLNSWRCGGSPCRAVIYAQT